MRDHTTRTRRPAAKRVVGVRELKAQAARILRQVRDARASYVLTHRGRAVGVILPLEPAAEPFPAETDARTAWEAFLRAGRRLERRFAPDASGVRLPTESRR
jgi:prevent-host-death family protein